MKHTDGEPRKPKTGEHIANIVANLIFLWVLSMVPRWDLAFLEDNYMIVLLIMKLNCIVQIVASALLIILHVRPLRTVVKIVAEAAGFVPLVMLYYIYPLNFSVYHNMGWLDRVLPIIFIIAMVVTGIKILSLVIKLFFGQADKSNVVDSDFR